MRTFIFLLVTLAISASSGVNGQLKPYDVGEILPVPTECPKVHDPSVTVHIAHETDCDKFYTCSLGKPHLKVCPSGLHFNPRKQVCDLPVSAGCIIPTTETTTPESTTTTTEGTTTKLCTSTPTPTTTTTEAVTHTPETTTPTTTTTTEAVSHTPETTTSTTVAASPTTEASIPQHTTTTPYILINIFIKNSSIAFNSKLY